MEQNQEIEKVLQNGYHLDIGEIINQSFDNFKKSFLIAGVAMFLFALIMSFFGFGIILFFTSASDVSDALANFKFSNFSLIQQILSLTGILAISSISTIITAGFYRLFFKSSVNENVELGDVFYYFKSTHLKELIVAGAITGGISFVTSQYLDQYMLFSGTLVSYFITYCTVFVIPLIIFKNCSALQAFPYSFKLVFKQPIVILILLIFSIIIAILGVIALCIGIIFTMSYVYCMIYTIFNNIFPYNRTSPLDEIGKSY